MRLAAMKTFIHEDFLLSSPSGRRLYHAFAKQQPILDYHNHLDPAAIAGDRRWENLTQVWLAGDHYKWRAMRANGVPERCITGDAPDREKFQAWAETVPATIGNALHHWTHLELAQVFGITDRLLDGKSAQWVWDRSRECLASPEFSARGLLRRYQVKLLCTTDDPLDDLASHRRLAADPTCEVKVLPTFRPDRFLDCSQPQDFLARIAELEASASASIADYPAYVAALAARMEHFAAHGCRLADHGITRLPDAEPDSEAACRIFAALMHAVRQGKGIDVPAQELEVLQATLLRDLAGLYHVRDWTQQYHIGAQRNVNRAAFKHLGPDSGHDTIGEGALVEPLARLLSAMDQQGTLPRTILYHLNPGKLEALAALGGCFQSEGIASKIQLGSAWWFLDQKDGMEHHYRVLSRFGLMRHFVGMLTDSRSFLSFSRHDYFRRIWCNCMGKDLDEGLLPADWDLMGEVVQAVCYGNATRYFRFED
jgi:glucuronate isomerase